MIYLLLELLECEQNLINGEKKNHFPGTDHLTSGRIENPASVALLSMTYSFPIFAKKYCT